MSSKDRVFLSRVTADFGTEASELGRKLRNLGFSVEEQPDWASGNFDQSTWRSMADKIRRCGHFIGFVGDQDGWRPPLSSVPEEWRETFQDKGDPADVTRSRYSITQWEFFLAVELRDQRPQPGLVQLWERQTEVASPGQRQFANDIRAGGHRIARFASIEAMALNFQILVRSSRFDPVMFTRISERSPHFGRDDVQDERLSYADFKNRTFEPFDVAQDVRRALLAGPVWLRSPSASGKTSIALSLAVEAIKGNRDTFLLDLRDLPRGFDRTDFFDELRRARPAKALVILENAHADPRLSEEAIEIWNLAEGDGKLLILGWPHVGGEAYGSWVFEHRLTASDLLKLWRFWAGRIARVVSQVPAEEAAKWAQVHGADLVVFQYCIRHALVKGDRQLVLDPASAEAIVRDRYLVPAASEGWLADLLALALVSSVGLRLQSQLLAKSDRLPRTLAVESRHGVIGQHAQFALWHEALGRLILRSAGESRCVEALGNRVRQSPASGLLIASHLKRLDRGVWAELLARSALEGATELGDVPLGSLVALHINLQSLIDLVPEAKERLRELAEELRPGGRFFEAVQFTSPDQVSGFFEWWEDRIPGSSLPTRTAEQLTALSKAKLQLWALRSGPETLAHFVTALGGKEAWRAVAEALGTAFGKMADEEPDRLAEWALRSGPDKLAHFVTALGGKEAWRAVAEALGTAFGKIADEEPDRLAEWALRSGPETLAHFVLKLGAHPEWGRTADLGRKFLTRDTRRFLGYSFQQQLLVVRALDEPSRRSLLAAISPDDWSANIPNLLATGAVAFGAWAKALDTLGETEKVAACAKILINPDSLSLWKVPMIRMFDFLEVLKYGPQPIAAKEALVADLTPRWFSWRIANHETWQIAQAIFICLRRPPLRNNDWLPIGALKYRARSGIESVIADANSGTESNEEALREAGARVQLWAGAGMLIRARQCPRWEMGAPAAAYWERLAIEMAPKEGAVFGHTQQQFWMGMRAVARGVSKPIVADKTVLIQVRDAWREWVAVTEGVGDFDRRAAAAMDRWLELAISSGGRLPKENTGLIDALGVRKLIV